MSKPISAFAILKKAILEAARHIYNIRGVTDKADLVTAVYERLHSPEGLSPSIIKQMFLEMIGEIVTDRLEQVSGRGAAQLDLFNDFEFMFSLPKGDGGRKVIELGDLRIPDIEAVRAQKENNIKAAQTALEHFNEACTLIVPLLQANPEWKWRDAAEDLKSRGMV